MNFLNILNAFPYPSCVSYPKTRCFKKTLNLCVSEAILAFIFAFFGQPTNFKTAGRGRKHVLAVKKKHFFWARIPHKKLRVKFWNDKISMKTLIEKNGSIQNELVARWYLFFFSQIAPTLKWPHVAGGGRGPVLTFFSGLG